MTEQTSRDAQSPGVQSPGAQSPDGPSADERIKDVPLMARLMKRPELGAVAGLIIVTVFFAFTADATMFTLAGFMNFMSPAAQLGILAIGAAMLMIGGEFDLSLGSMVAFAGLIFGAAVVAFQIPLIAAIPLTFVFAALVGAVNATIVIRTGLPSFIVTLAFLFILRGLSLVGLKLATGGSTQLRGVRDAVEGSWLAGLFLGRGADRPLLVARRERHDRDLQERQPEGDGRAGGGVLVPPPHHRRHGRVVAHARRQLDLRRGRRPGGGVEFGACRSGGSRPGSFMFTACCTALVAIITVLDSGSTDARRGFQKEFEAIIAAVIGGCLLTGGYGSAIGAAIGAVIFGMVLIGLSYTSIDQDWYLVFLGGMLLVAVLFNNMIRRRVTGERS